MYVGVNVDGVSIFKTSDKVRPFRLSQRSLNSKEQLTGIDGVPLFFPRQKESFDHADKDGDDHRFFGNFQIFRSEWHWSPCGRKEGRKCADASCTVGVEDVSEQAGDFYDEAVYEYFSFPTVAAFLLFYERVPQDRRFFFETLPENQMARAYIDVDNLIPGNHEACNDTVDKILLLLREFYESVFGGRELLRAHIAVTTGGRAKEADYKNSWHISLDTGFGFVSSGGSDDDMKQFIFAFIESLREKHPELRDGEVSVDHGNLPVDHRVYTRNRAMRVALSCKTGDTTPLQCVPPADGAVCNLAKYLLQTDEELEKYGPGDAGDSAGEGEDESEEVEPHRYTVNATLV